MVSLNATGKKEEPGQSNDPTGAHGKSPNESSEKPLDVVFLQDTTGSQGPYIQSARKAIRDICDKISASTNLAKESIRFGLIAFRDHPPQDQTYVTKDFGFTSNINVMQNNLSSLIASGGGDGPEAQTAALAAALNMTWKEDAIKMVILITDAPPHGLGESGDGFSESPDQNDPIDIVRQMAERGITLFVIACEPALSKYKHAVDFYAGITKITDGKMFSLMMADKLGDYIVGTAIETIETEKLISEFEQVIVDDVYGNAMPLETVMQNVQEEMSKRKVRIHTMEVDNIYHDSPQSIANTNIWGTAGNIGAARKQVKPIGTPRMREEYSSRAQAPAMSVAPQAFGMAHAHRVVTQSVARSSHVTSEGMTPRFEITRMAPPDLPGPPTPPPT